MKKLGIDCSCTLKCTHNFYFSNLQLPWIKYLLIFLGKCTLQTLKILRESRLTEAITSITKIQTHLLNPSFSDASEKSKIEFLFCRNTFLNRRLNTELLYLHKMQIFDFNTNEAMVPLSIPCRTIVTPCAVVFLLPLSKTSW